MRGQCHIASVASCSQIIRVPWKLNYYILFHLNFSIQIQFSLFADVLLLNVFNSKVHLPCTIAMIWNIPVTPNLFCLPCFFSLVYLIYDTRRWGADAAKSLQSCPTLCDPTDGTAAHKAPPSLGFSRQEHWSGMPFPSPMNESEKWKWSRSVVSDSSWPHGLQPTRLLHPWDFPGKSTGVGCHCLLPMRC